MRGEEEAEDCLEGGGRCGAPVEPVLVGKLGEEQGVAGGGGLGEGLSRDRGQEARGQEELHCHPGSQLELVGDEVGEGGEGCVLCLGQ